MHIAKLHVTRGVLLSFGLSLALLACTAPSDQVDGDLGELRQVSFSYRDGCFFGCSLEQPLLTGAHQTIQVSEQGDRNGVTAHTDDDDVLELFVERACFCERGEEGAAGSARVDIAVDASCKSPWRKRCDNDVVVQGEADGDTKVELRDADGDVLDRATVHVRDADRATFFATLPDELGRRERTSLEASAGDNLELEVELYDRDGRTLLARDAVHWSSSAPEVAIVTAWLLGSGAEIDAGTQVTVQALEAGESTLRVEVPGLVEELALTVR